MITTREALPSLDGDSESFVQKNLEQISAEAGRSLLRVAGIRGTDAQLEQATRDFGNHALGVNVLAAYLQEMPGREVQHARLIPDLDIPDEEGRHPRRVMEVFAKKFEGHPELNVLNMMGLFDRPATPGEITALRTQTEIPELTARVRWLTDDEWQRTIHNLRSVRLLAPQSHHDPGGLDAHPLVREHFGQRLQKANDEAWKQGHSHLYEYLSKIAPRLPETLEEMAPLFVAVAHGCKAGRHQEALDDVYHSRIIRDGQTMYSVKQLGAIAPDLAALSGFFGTPWKLPVDALSKGARGFVLGTVGFELQALGRVREALEPMHAALEARLAVQDWMNAARAAYNLNDLFLTLGEIPQALEFAQQSVEAADQSGDAFHRWVGRTVLGEVLHRAGRLPKARTAFGEAEQMQTKRQPRHRFLYSVAGFRYCDLLLDVGDYRAVSERAAQTLVVATRNRWLLDIALDHLSVGRARLVGVQREESSDFAEVDDYLRQAVDGLRKAGTQDKVPRGLLARAEYYRIRAQREAPGEFFERARRDVDEAMTIARRGEMRLHECDCHLEYAHLHLAQGEKDEARTHFDSARKMVDEMGYHRRDAEVLLIRARLELLEGNRKRARQTLAAAKKRIDEMGCHRWDIDAAEIEAEL